MLRITIHVTYYNSRYVLQFTLRITIHVTYYNSRYVLQFMLRITIHVTYYNSCYILQFTLRITIHVTYYNSRYVLQFTLRITIHVTYYNSRYVLQSNDLCLQSFQRQSYLLFRILSSVNSHSSSPHLSQLLLRLDFNKYFTISGGQLGKWVKSLYS